MYTKTITFNPTSWHPGWHDNAKQIAWHERTCLCIWTAFLKRNPVFLSIVGRENEKRALKRPLVFDSQRKRQLKLKKTLLPSCYNGYPRFRQRKVTFVCYDLLMSICILVVNRWNSLFAPHRWNFSRQEYVLRSTFYIAESSFAFCEELAHKKGRFSSARPSSITLSRFPCHQNFWAKVIAVLAMIQTGVSILKTISLAFCDLRAGKWNSCPSNINKQSCHWINGRRSCKIITKVHS